MTRMRHGPQRTRRAAGPHRRPVSLDRSLRCAPLVAPGATARNAPCERTRETGQMSHYQRALVLQSRPGPSDSGSPVQPHRCDDTGRHVGAGRVRGTVRLSPPSFREQPSPPAATSRPRPYPLPIAACRLLSPRRSERHRRDGRRPGQKVFRTPNSTELLRYSRSKGAPPNSAIPMSEVPKNR